VFADVVQAGGTAEPDDIVSSIASPRGFDQEGRRLFDLWKTSLWYYELDSAASRRLADGDGFFLDPQFKSSADVTFIRRARDDGDAIYRVPVTGGRAREVVRQDGLVAHGWNPAGDTVAYATNDRLFVKRDGMRSRVVRRFSVGSGYGRGGTDQDEQIVMWSPDGSMILVQQTAHCCPRDGTPTVYLVRPDGTDVVTPFNGTFTRWAPDSRTIYSEVFDGIGSWFSIDIASGARSPLPNSHRGFHLSVSPDGRRLVYDRGSNSPTTWIYDLTSHTEKAISPTGFVVPIWMSDDTVLVTAVRACAAGQSCGGEAGLPWRPTGRTALIDVVRMTREVELAHWTLTASAG
jgi:Tol biopolymer transport system component